ncbi:HAMP domain-containing histidine kinase, partial [Halorubrum sp. SS5]
SDDAFGSADEEDPFGEDAAGRDEPDAPVEVVVEADGEIYADPGRVRQLLGNLYRNAAEHGGQRVVVGDLPDGFYVEDDGP